MTDVPCVRLDDVDRDATQSWGVVPPVNLTSRPSSPSASTALTAERERATASRHRGQQHLWCVVRGRVPLELGVVEARGFELIVGDPDATVTRLEAADVRFRPAIAEGNGGRQVLVEDPSGNPVEVFESTA